MNDKRNIYASLVDPTDFRTVQRYFRAGRDIKEIVLVQEGHDIAQVAALLACDAPTRKERGFALAKEGAILFAVEDPKAVPEPWRPFAVPMKDFDEGERCRVIFEPPTYYVQREGQVVTRPEARDGQEPRPCRDEHDVKHHNEEIRENKDKILDLLKELVQERGQEQPARARHPAKWEQDHICVLDRIRLGDFVLRLYIDLSPQAEGGIGWILTHLGPREERTVREGIGHNYEVLEGVIEEHMLGSYPDRERLEARTGSLPMGKTIFELYKAALGVENGWGSARRLGNWRAAKELFDAYRDSGILQIDANREVEWEAIDERALEDFASRGGFEDPKAHLIVAATAASATDCERLNVAIQWERWRRGDLGAERLCYQRPGRFDSTRHFMLCEGDRVLINEPARGHDRGPSELGTVLGIDRGSGLFTVGLDRGDKVSVSARHLLEPYKDGPLHSSVREPVALGYAVESFPERPPANAYVLLGGDYIEGNPDDDARGAMKAALLQKTATGVVRIYADKFVDAYRGLWVPPDRGRVCKSRLPLVIEKGDRSVGHDRPRDVPQDNTGRDASPGRERKESFEVADVERPSAARPAGQTVTRGGRAGTEPEKPESNRDTSFGQFVLRRSVDTARPEGEGLRWDLFVVPGDEKDRVWGGTGHDVKRIKEEILENQEKIFGRVKELTREKGQEQRVRTRDIEQEM